MAPIQRPNGISEDVITDLSKIARLMVISAALIKERILLMPGTDFSRVLLASALGHLGDGDEARRIWKELKEINPKYSFSEHFARQPFKKEEDVGRIAEGLAKAGLSN
jgi:adenylate cyclase